MITVEQDYLEDLKIRLKDIGELDYQYMIDLVDNLLVEMDKPELAQGLFNIFDLEDIYEYADERDLVELNQNAVNAYIDEADEHDVVDMVNFNNAERIAYNLAFHKPLEGSALLEELLYWRDKGRI